MALTPVYREPAYTSAEDMERKDGSIGTLKIPSLDINMKVWEGETNASMAKGLGHYTTTSAWDGNVAVCGHNRGAKYVIGDIKDLEIGDTITYTTIRQPHHHHHLSSQPAQQTSLCSGCGSGSLKPLRRNGFAVLSFIGAVISNKPLTRLDFCIILKSLRRI